MGNLVLGRELIRPFLGARVDSRQFEPLVLARAGDHPVGDEVGADDAESHLAVSHLRKGALTTSALRLLLRTLI